MLTYLRTTSTLRRVSSILVGDTTRNGLEKNFKKTKQAKAYYLSFIVRNLPAEFFPVDNFEFLDRFTAELLWRPHALHFTYAPIIKKAWQVCLIRHA